MRGVRPKFLKYSSLCLDMVVRHGDEIAYRAKLGQDRTQRGNES